MGGLATLGSHRVQLVISELRCLLLAEIGLLPDALEQAEPEVLAQGVFDNVGVAPAGSSGVDARSTEHLWVEVDSRFGASHAHKLPS